MQAENIYNRLGEDLTKWQALLVQIRKARGTFDNAETRKEFGPVIIDYGKVTAAWCYVDLEMATSSSSSLSNDGAYEII